MGARPSGTVTFLFTDIEGSTRLWETDPAGMRLALAAHDQMVRAAVDAHDGYVFSTGGDGLAVAFTRAEAAIDAAVEAQRSLQAWPWPTGALIRVRMGVATGEAQERDGDYFGPVLNRAARVMATGHGGQIVLAGVTAGLVDGVDLVDLGENRLRDLSGTEHLFQVRADGLRRDFPALRTLDSVPGNLPVQTTSFVGRQVAVEKLVTAVRNHRLVTLTGVGGVGKTRLAVQVAGHLVPEFADGVWLVELAPLGDPALLPDGVATVLGVSPQAGRSVTDCVVEALSGRRMLMVLDNCEHVLDAAAELVEAILVRTKMVKVMATSREGLRVGGEHLWAVPSLGVDGDGSEAVELFVERAREVDASFSLDDEADTQAVSMICRQLDGIALGVELAAARMVSMSAQDVRDRLDDRFRLLAGGRRGVGRHQTLRQAVGWSHDLLNENERRLLNRCAVFAGGFDLGAATHICDGFDEYSVLDVLDSLVRKSLVNVEVVEGHARYWLLETIRQFAEEKLARQTDIAAIRDRHARYFGEQAVAHWTMWDGPRMRVALDWVDAEFANLRAGFRWAADHHDLDTAAAISAHTTLLAHVLQRWEPIGWVEEILEAATTADRPWLPRLFTAVSLCVNTGQPEDAVRYAQTAVALEADPRYNGCQPGFSAVLEASAHVYSGRIERGMELCADLVIHLQTVSSRVFAQGFLMWLLTAAGRDTEAITLADETLPAARTHGNPLYVAGVLANGYGRGYAATDPHRALHAFREALESCRAHRLLYGEAYIAYDAARLEASHGDLHTALELFDFTIDSWQRAGDYPNLAVALASLAVHFEYVKQPGIAATLYGASTRSQIIAVVPGLPEILEHLRAVLGRPVFDDCVASGAALELGDAVAYARHQIRLALHQSTPPM